MGQEYPAISFENLTNTGVAIRQIIQETLSQNTWDENATGHLPLIQVCQTSVNDTPKEPNGSRTTDWDTGLRKNYVEACHAYNAQRVTEDFLYINAPRKDWEFMLHTAAAKIENAETNGEWIQISDCLLTIAILAPDEDLRDAAAKKWAELLMDHYGDNPEMCAHALGQIMMNRNYFPTGWPIQKYSAELFRSMHEPGTIPEEEQIPSLES